MRVRYGVVASHIIHRMQSNQCQQFSNSNLGLNWLQSHVGMYVGLVLTLLMTIKSYYTVDHI